MKAAADSVNYLAVDLYGEIRSTEGNLAFSPYSVTLALGMAYSGARGATESQMARALHLNLPQANVSEAFAEVTSRVLSSGKEGAVEMDIANALWAEKSYPLLKEYLESVKAYSEPRGWLSRFFDQGLYRQLDFKHNADASRNTINKWVEDHTKNKIKDLLAPGSVNQLTRLVLTSAIYFNGKWQNQFYRELTKDDTFTTMNGATSIVPMMHQEALFGYAEEPGLQVLEMQYRGQDLSMVVLLPAKEQSFKDFEQSITYDKLEQGTGKLPLKVVKVFLPRFKMTSEFDLTQPLSKLGMKDAFTNADFSGMTGNTDLFISRVMHKVFVDTNEDGTEAAAASAIMSRSGTMKNSPSVPIFRADHPFVLLIRHRPSNSILFLGRVTDPGQLVY
jgi:serpin B